MNRIPGTPRMPNIKNRSSKQLYLLTRAGHRMMWAWHKECGIQEFKMPRPPKKAADKNPESK